MNLNVTHKIPKCLILIASFNGAKYLPEQLNSIYAQIDVNVDIWFSDDGSNDQSENILKAFGCKNLNTQRKKHSSACDNFLFLIRNAQLEQYDYIFLSDQDDIWLPNKLTRAINQINHHRSDCYSGSYYIFEEERRKITYRNKSFNYTGCEHFFRSPGPGFTYGFTNKAFSQIQHKLKTLDVLHNKYRWHDWLVYAIAMELKLKWIIDQEPHALYRQHQQNDTGQNTTIKGLIYRINFLFSGQYRNEVLKMTNISETTNLQTLITRFTVFDRLRLISIIPKIRSGKSQQIVLLIWLILGFK